jgi:YggT family protein
MQWVRIPFSNPVGAFICAMTDWLVLPLRRLLKGGFGLDWASLAAAIFLELGLSALFDLATGKLLWFKSGALIAAWLLNGMFGLALTALTMMLWLTVACALLSWIRVDSPVADVFDAIAAPWLKPIRRRLPMVGGFDLSPLVLLVLLQIGLLLLTRGQGYALMLLR